MSTKMKDLPLFYAPALREELQLPEGEAQHAIRVLRAKVGDEFLVTDGCGTLFATRVSGVDRRHCLLSRRAVGEVLAWALGGSRCPDEEHRPPRVDAREDGRGRSG